MDEILSPLEFDDAARALSTRAIVKDEYETTAAFEARLKAVQMEQPRTLLVRYTPNRRFLKYDADEGALEVGSYFFNNLSADYSAAFGATTDFAGEIQYGDHFNIDVVLSQSEFVVGQYSASNAYGATFEVSEVNRTTRAIWEREAKSYNEGLFSDAPRSEIGHIRMPPSTAKSLQANSLAALLIEPRWPYVVQGFKRWRPNIHSQKDVHETLSVIVADIQCAFVLDAGHRVVKAFATRGLCNTGLARAIPFDAGFATDLQCTLVPSERRNACNTLLRRLMATGNHPRTGSQQ